MVIECMEAINQRLQKHSTRDTSSRQLNGRHCLLCDLVGRGQYAAIGVSNNAWARRMGLGEGKQPPAHRVAWVLVNGRIPRGRKVLHLCDRPKCVEPKHLFLGTQADNVRDMIRKGRMNPSIGEKNGSAVLSEIEVREIFYSVDRQADIALRYGISIPLVQKIKYGKIWKHLKLGGPKW